MRVNFLHAALRNSQFLKWFSEKEASIPYQDLEGRHEEALKTHRMGEGNGGTGDGGKNCNKCFTCDSSCFTFINKQSRLSAAGKWRSPDSLWLLIWTGRVSS